MHELSREDFSLTLNFLETLYRPCHPDEFPLHLLSSLSQLVGAEVFGATYFNLTGAAPPSHHTYPSSEAGVLAQSATSTIDSFLENPLSSNYLKTLNGEAFAISDFLSERDFHGNATLYEGYFQPLGLEDQMGICVDLSQAGHQYAPTIGPTNVGISLNRNRRNFSDRDRLLLNLVRPHVQQAYQTMVGLASVNQQLGQLQDATSHTGLIILSVDGQVQWMTKRAAKLLKKYFDADMSGLPDILYRWVSLQISKTRRGIDLLSEEHKICIESQGNRLTVRYAIDSVFERSYLLLEETSVQGLSVESLQLLGLSSREAEVLFLIAKGYDTKQVAQTLYISERTVKKHLENINKKLGVQTRVAAVMLALKKLGVVNLATLIDGGGHSQGTS